MSRRTQYPWGQDLLGLSLTSLWHAAQWEDVGEDELAFLLPALSRWRPSDSDGADHGPVGDLTSILRARALSATALMVARSQGGLTVADALAWLSASRVLTQIAAEETRLGASPEQLGYEELPFRTLEALHVPRAWMINELTAVAYLDRLLKDARGKVSATTPLIDWPLSLADAIVCTIHSRLNAAYVYPEYGFAHETLTAAAVLGHMLAGRPAYLPPYVAQCFIEALSTNSTREDHFPLWVLRTYAEMACGSAYLLTLAKRVCRIGRPFLAKPRRISRIADLGQLAWNSRFLDRLEREPFLTSRRAA